MTPEQIALVESSITALDLDDLAAEFYERAFGADPTLTGMFTGNPEAQRARFVAELGEIVYSIGSLDTFAAHAQALGARHRDDGARAAHYRLMGEALLAALAAASGEAWTGDLQEAWTLAYNLTSETMMIGATQDRPAD